MAKKYYAVNCHYDMVITVDVVAESEQEAIEKAKSNADFADINKWAECYGSSECIAEEQDLTDELQQQVDEQQAMFDEKTEEPEKPNKVMVLCSYDEDDNDTDVHLVVSKHQFDTDKEGIREAIEGIWDLDLYDEEDLDELRECISNLLQGDNGYFGSEYYWEEKDCVL